MVYVKLSIRVNEWIHQIGDVFLLETNEYPGSGSPVTSSDIALWTIQLGWSRNRIAICVRTFPIVMVFWKLLS